MMIISLSVIDDKVQPVESWETWDIYEIFKDFNFEMIIDGINEGKYLTEDI